MIHYIKGKLGMFIKGGVVIEANSIGYEVFVPDNSDCYRKAEGTDIMLFTEMVVREDDISLYGFMDKEELRIFKMLTTVNGVGAKAAMAILSALPIEELKRAIIHSDVAMLTRANGVGKKIAQRLVLELKDKFDKDADSSCNAQNVDFETDAQNEKAEAVAALISLGYSKSEAQEAVLSLKDEGLGVSEYIRLALRRLS